MNPIHKMKFDGDIADKEDMKYIWFLLVVALAIIGIIIFGWWLVKEGIILG